MNRSSQLAADNRVRVKKPVLAFPSNYAKGVMLTPEIEAVVIFTMPKGNDMAVLVEFSLDNHKFRALTYASNLNKVTQPRRSGMTQEVAIVPSESTKQRRANVVRLKRKYNRSV